ncbi:MAG TPA: hypothetical protein PLJ27_07275 [Polyangiaceae bacterium]|nr:MAG: hypothetical protein BWY17_04940 [Deltaproteobacteria bacterium ADurb.Bin207]HNS96620.1 hypothetical protein [Polyangiaceae bacterium]HNZ21042.1 hypothetical protein [Polyangiaceae bacterium]HOD22334.1 hypothetical protein [Polyangiaceae bacterium]HOE51290.1 hypothetical protein [Polyangiaceae bacterium]
MSLPTLEAFLNVAAQTVTLHETGPEAPCALTQWLAKTVPWIQVHATQGPAPRTLCLRGPNSHGTIQFVGDLAHRMIEPLAITVRALGTGQVDLDTPATPVFLSELVRPVHLRLVVSVACPYCPASAAVVLRLACITDKVHVQIIRADLEDAPRVHAVPTLFVGNEELLTGPMAEMAVVEAIAR